MAVGKKISKDGFDRRWLWLKAVWFIDQCFLSHWRIYEYLWNYYFLRYKYFDILRSIQSALILIKSPILSTPVSFMNIGVFFQFIPGYERSLPRLFRQKELIPPAKLTFILSCSLISHVRPLCISIKHTRIHTILLLWLSIKIIESLSSLGFMFFP